MSDIELAHTWELDATDLAKIREFLTLAYDGEFSDTDWANSLGGVHALIWADDELIAHGSVVQRRMLVADRLLRTGYIEAIATHPEHRRNGYGNAIMDGLELVLRGAYELGALSTGGDAVRLYTERGWQLWEGPTSVFGRSGVELTPDEDGGIYVLPVTGPVNLSGPITCDFRDGDVW
ncbi:GNAT family N-acetyltransferase [Pseudonocardiaceae bacterium YIM PH 21723]|nr:GNAT family N-acetyltransferase [Pseudonocardiaceae bacterium YIM PH 21723]